MLMSCAGEVPRALARAQKELALSIAAPELGAKGAASFDVSLGIAMLPPQSSKRRLNV
jgi:hypothetical protein